MTQVLGTEFFISERTLNNLGCPGMDHIDQAPLKLQDVSSATTAGHGFTFNFRYMGVLPTSMYAHHTTPPELQGLQIENNGPLVV